MSQAFFTAEIYTGKKAAFVPIADTINDFATVLSGKKKAITTNRFLYIDSLTNEWHSNANAMANEE